MRCHHSPLILASYQRYIHKVLEWVQTNQIPRSRSRSFSKTTVCLVQHHAEGDLPFVALSHGKLQEGIQASRKFEECRPVIFYHSSSLRDGKQKGKLSSLRAVPQGHQNCVVCSKVATNPVPLAQSIGPRRALVAECPVLSLFLLADLRRRALLCKGPHFWVLHCHSVISNNTPVSHPSLLLRVGSCREKLIGYSWLIKHALLESKLHSLLLNVSHVAAL